MEEKNEYDLPLEIGNCLLVADNNSVMKIEKSTDDIHEKYDLKLPTMDMVHEDGLIYYDLETMEEKWKYDDIGSLKSNCEIINDSSIIYLANNQLHAISKKMVKSYGKRKILELEIAYRPVLQKTIYSATSY